MNEPAKETLIFQWAGLLAAFGDIVVGERRPSHPEPSQSAVYGVLAAALGIRRDEEARLLALQSHFRVVIATLSGGHYLRDYHTAQVAGQPDLKKRPHRTRADELNLPRHQLNTMLSSRDYYSDGHWLIAVQRIDDISDNAMPDAQSHRPASAMDSPDMTMLPTLAGLMAGLQKPHFVTYLGRKACPPSLPFFPQILPATTDLLSLFDQYLSRLAQLFEPAPALKTGWGRTLMQRQQDAIARLHVQRIVWDDRWQHDVPAGFMPPSRYQATRHDRLLSRRRWQFANRSLLVWTKASDGQTTAVPAGEA